MHQGLVGPSTGAAEFPGGISSPHRYGLPMSSDARAALDRFVAALERHYDAASARRSELDPKVVEAYEELATAFAEYDDALFDAYDEVTPFDLTDEDDEDDDLDDEDDLDEDDDEDEDEDDDLDDEDDDLDEDDDEDEDDDLEDDDEDTASAPL